MQAADMDTRLSTALIGIIRQCWKGTKVSGVLPMAELLGVAASHVGIAIRLRRRARLHGSIRPLREVTADAAGILLEALSELQHACFHSDDYCCGQFDEIGAFAHPRSQSVTPVGRSPLSRCAPGVRSH